MSSKICGMTNCKHMKLRFNAETHESELRCDRHCAWLNTKKNPNRKLAADEATDLALRCDACLRDDSYEPEEK